MKNATKVLLETIQVTRHVGQLALRPVEKAAREGAQASEDLAFWALRLQPVQDLLGRHNAKQLVDSYLKAKDVASESVASMSHQSWKSALQSGAQVATHSLQNCGVEAKVVGPFDEHWNAVKVLKDLRAAASASAVRNNHRGLQFTPKQFVQFMRDSERRRRREHWRDPVEEYIEELLKGGALKSMAPMVLEKRLYMDVARVICYAFDRAMSEANGMDVWGHELRVKVVRRGNEDAPQPKTHLHTAVGTEQIETIVDWMLRSPDLEAPVVMEGLQRQLLVNCTVMILELLQDLISERHMRVGILGHSLHVHMEPWPLGELLSAVKGSDINQRFPVNSNAINELVDALIEEPEVQLILVPDLLEAEVYRYVLHRIICIGEFILSQLRVRLFGLDIKLSIVAEESSSAPDDDASSSLLQVSAEELQELYDKLEDERVRVERSLQMRRMGSEQSLEGMWTMPEDVDTMLHEFQQMAAQDPLSRSLSLQRNFAIPIDVAYRMIADISEYPKWMPLCNSASVSHAEGSGISYCEIGYGWETGTMLGTLGDRVKYRMMFSAPTPAKERPQDGEICRSARIVADTLDGFAYGKRLVYDWRFTELVPGETDVRLDMFFQAKSVFFLPLWDSIHSTVVAAMMKQFQERADALGRT